jgi:hypothetical protein
LPSELCSSVFRSLSADQLESAVENWYDHVKLTDDARRRLRRVVRTYAEGKLQTAQQESERAARRIEQLKQEQQRLLHLSYRDLVDEDVLVAEQARIKGNGLRRSSGPRRPRTTARTSSRRWKRHCDSSSTPRPPTGPPAR